MEIHWTHAGELPEEVREAFDQRLRTLAEGNSDLIDVRIVFRRSGHHRHGGQEVRITCDARNHELVVARTRDDAPQALDEAFDAFEREVWRMRHKRTGRREERGARPPELGIVDRLLPGEGYGFILTDAGERVYFHRNAVRGGLGFETLQEGQRVGLDFERGDKGLQATSVVMPPADSPGP